MPRLKQKKAIDLPEFLKKDTAMIKEDKAKTPVVITQPEITKPEIAESAIVQPVVSQPEITKPEIDKSSIFKPIMLPEKNQKLNKDIWKKIIAGVVLGILVVLAGTTFYFYYQWRQTKTNPQEVAQDALSEIVAEVGNLIELPTDETPTMATVTSVEKLKDQPFFAKAQNGDKALIYSQAGKAILYRPASHKIIEVISLIGGGQLSDNQLPQDSQTPVATSEAEPVVVDTPTSETEAEAPKIATVAVFNGTNQKGLAGNVAAEISGITEIKVVQTGNAKGIFTKTTIVDLSGKNPAVVQKIIETIGGEAGAMPEGETQPEADILVIAGKE